MQEQIRLIIVGLHNFWLNERTVRRENMCMCQVVSALAAQCVVGGGDRTAVYVIWGSSVDVVR